MANKSMAVWCVPRSAGQNTGFEVHINFWRIAGDASFASQHPGLGDFLEIGIMVETPANLDRICIFLPEPIARAAVRDCSGYLQDRTIAQGIFNEVVGGTNSANAPRAIELRTNSGVFCQVHSFLVPTPGPEIDGSELDIVQHQEGTILTIMRRAVDEVCHAAGGQDRAYFRLRIYLDAEQWIMKVIRPVDRPLQSGYDELTYVDFRLNEARTLPTRIETMMRQEQAASNPLTLVAFLTATPIDSSIVESSPQYKLRVLEWSIWRQYVDHELPTDMMIYHWKRQEPAIQDFSAYVKLGARRTSANIVRTYLLIAFLFGVLGNLAASGIEAGIGWLFSRPAVSQPARVEYQKQRLLVNQDRDGGGQKGATGWAERPLENGK